MRKSEWVCVRLFTLAVAMVTAYFAPPHLYTAVCMGGTKSQLTNEKFTVCMYASVCMSVCGCSKLRFSLYVYVCVYFCDAAMLHIHLLGVWDFHYFIHFQRFFSLLALCLRVGLLFCVQFILYIHTRVYDFEFYLNVNVGFVYENDERSPIYWIIIGFWNFSNDFRNLRECNVPTAFYAHISVNIRLYTAGIHIFIYNVTKYARWFAFMKCTENKIARCEI